jgi:hypothetical protein
LQRFYIDNFYFGKGSSASTISILDYLLGSTTVFDHFDHIVLSGDTGSGFRQTETLYYYSKVFQLHGKHVSVELLAPGHAWNMCDSHGGHLSDLFAPLKMTNELVTPQDACNAVNSSSMVNTTAFMHENPHARPAEAGHYKETGITDFLSFHFAYTDAHGDETHTEGVCVARQLSGKGKHKLFDLRVSRAKLPRCQDCETRLQRPVDQHAPEDVCPTLAAREDFIDASVKPGSAAGVRNPGQQKKSKRKRKDVTAKAKAPKKPKKPKQDAEERKDSEQDSTPLLTEGEILLVEYEGRHCLCEVFEVQADQSFTVQFWGRATLTGRYYPSWTDDEGDEDFMVDEKRDTRMKEAEANADALQLDPTTNTDPIPHAQILYRNIALKKGFPPRHISKLINTRIGR